MPLEAPLDPVALRVAELNTRLANHGAMAVLRHAMSDAQVGRIALVSSFGAESVVLLHMAATIDRHVPVIFLDTEMLFHETIQYQEMLAEQLGLSDLRRIRPDRAETARRDLQGTLHRSEPDACCTLRKSEPLDRALGTFDAWITGRKRFQGGARTGLDFFEAGDDGRIKVNPLAHWTRDDIADYMLNNRLPRHPLVRHGYRSIGCAPCTSRVRDGEDERAGRWRGQDKVECGIHFKDGKMVRTTG
ncbi:phosphoadenylyl-sulfate reductase [Palleronia sp. LCG004]|uniref:phosphoadenylyl-sulfate reductase n=1 Tax=Palleronia sp. LCG004 TaxID=3079304 RepID=UPI002943EEA1|nr:phosphoadenylyl-sulfate reductase [Palleronia sp. LCG004]WOI57307.1 phosphoadenylyl-sulfate reductase [Palleronia sp. LCG004]